MTVKRVALADLMSGPIRENRPHLNPDHVAYYQAHLDEASPVTVFDIAGHLLLADGHHRVEAARRLGRGGVQADVRPGSWQDALQFAVDLARQQRRLSEEEARAAIARRGYPPDLERERRAGHPPDPGNDDAGQ
jgi:hypothetical protein